MRQAASLEIWRTKAVVEDRALESVTTRGCEGETVSQPTAGGGIGGRL